MPEDDGISDDEFDGYLDADDDVGLHDDDAGADPRDADHGDSGSPIPDFEQPLGCSKDMSGASPLQFFQQMVSDQMLDNIVEQTNLYAQQYMESTNLPPNSRAHGWSHSPFNRVELKKFLAMTITMGIVSYPEMEDYWSTSLPYATPAFSKVCVILCSSQYPTLSCPGTPPLASLFHTRTHTLSLTHTYIQQLL